MESLCSYRVGKVTLLAMLKIWEMQGDAGDTEIEMQGSNLFLPINSSPYLIIHTLTTG